MKRYFITGLIILLPLALTFAVMIFIFNLLTEPFVGIVKAFFVYFNIFSDGFLFLSADQVQKYISQIIILVLLFFVTVGLGWLARWFFFHYLLIIWESILHRIPFVRGVYKSSQDIIQTIFSSSDRAFKQVVMVPFPSASSYAIGLVTRENLPHFSEKEKSNLVSVFVPTTPNPTSGFLMLFRTEDLVYLDMKVEEALKFIISCGVILAPFKKISREEILEMMPPPLDEGK